MKISLYFVHGDGTSTEENIEGENWDHVNALIVARLASADVLRVTVLEPMQPPAGSPTGEEPGEGGGGEGSGEDPQPDPMDQLP